MTIEMAASVAMTPAPSTPAAIRQRQQDHARTGGAADHNAIAERAERQPAVADLDAVIFQQPTQRHAQDQHAADHQRGAGARQSGIAPGAEHAGRHRRASTIAVRRQSTYFRNAKTRLELVNIAEIAMIGTTGSAPTSGTSTSGINAPVP